MYVRLLSFKQSVEARVPARVDQLVRYSAGLWSASLPDPIYSSPSEIWPFFSSARTLEGRRVP